MGFYDDLYELKEELERSGNTKGSKTVAKAIERLTTFEVSDDYKTILDSLEKRGRKIFRDESLPPEVREAVYKENQHSCELLRARANRYDNQRKKSERAKAIVITNKKKAKNASLVSKMDAESKDLIDGATGRATAPQVFNTACRHYCEARIGSSVSRSCDADMDMVFCSKSCAYATNTPFGLRA